MGGAEYFGLRKFVDNLDDMKAGRMVIDIVAGGLLAVIVITPAVADPINWAAEGVKLNKAGKYLAAAAAFREALAVDKASGIEDAQTIGVYDALASVYGEIGQYADAIREYRGAISLAEKIDNRNTLLRGLLFAKIAAIPDKNENYTEIAAQLQQAITICQRTASADQLAVLRVSLARIFTDQKKYRGAEQLLMEALADLRKQSNTAPRRVVDSLNALGVLLLDQQRYPEAITHNQESIAVIESNLGTEDPSLIIVLNNLAASYLKMHQCPQAAAALERAIPIAARTFGAEHPDYGYLLANYAAVLRELGRKHEAKKFKARSRQIESAFRRRYGVDSTIALKSLLNQ